MGEVGWKEKVIYKGKCGEGWGKWDKLKFEGFFYLIYLSK